MYTQLPTYEIYTYVVVWIAGVFYSVYEVYLTGKFFSHYAASDDFANGWTVLGRKKDVSDYEWKIWVDLLWTIAPWTCLHFFGAEFIRWRRQQWLPYWYLTISMIFLLIYIGPPATLFLLVQSCIFYLLLQSSSRTFVWVASLGLLAALNVDQTMEWLSIQEDRQYLLFVCMAWGHLRCLSFCFDCLSETRGDFTDLLSYQFYLPTLFLGPLILYKQFAKGILMSHRKWTMSRSLGLVLNLTRFVGWLIFTEFTLHYIYCNALQYQPQVVSQLSTWALCGLGYCMGQFFMNKYTVVYGLPGTIARAEQIEAPVHPKCIARIHLYSDMWKYFDRGLYNFLVKYIYVPCLGQKPDLRRKLLGSLVCFAFIYVWHRVYMFILVWSVLNFLGITIEGVAKYIGTRAFYQQWEKRWLSPYNSRRFLAVVASPLFAMSCISNFYFFGGMSIGNIFTKRFTADMTFSLCLVVLLFCYCCCQVSMEVKNWEERKSNCTRSGINKQNQ